MGTRGGSNDGTLPLITTDSVTADGSQAQVVQLGTVAAGVLTRTPLPALGTHGGLPVEGVASGTPVPVSGTVTATVGTVTAVTSITNVVHIDDNAGSLTVDGTVTTTPPSHASTNVDQIGGGTLALGAAASAAAIPVVLATDGATIGIVTETAPATDTASSGLNGRLQRIAQRLTSLIALLPSAIGITTKAGSLSVALASDQVSVPSWTDAQTIVAITTLAKGAVSTTAFAITSKFGAYVYVFIGRTGTTALDQSIHVRIRRKILTNPVIRNLYPEAAFESNKTAAVSGVCAGSGNNAGVTSLTLNAAKTYANGQNGEIWLAVLDSTSTPTSASEWVRVSVQTSTTVKLLDAPTISAHNNTGHNVADQADIFRAYVPGGATYELIIDYGQATTGDTVVIQALMQTLDSMAVA